jgi:SAM-dependent methyltransferase
MARNKGKVNPCLFLPSPTGISRGEVWRWYQNVGAELELEPFLPEEREYFRKYYEEVGLLTNWGKRFFHQHFSKTFWAASSFLMEGNTRPTIVDLGCGCGTQSLFLALKGAKIIALDMDSVALSLIEKRKRFYEEKLQRALDVSIRCLNVFDVDFGAFAPVHGLYSQFAFNMMQPTVKLLESISPHFDPRARVAILDGNNLCWLSRLLPSRRRKVCSPPQLRKEFEHRGFRIEEHCGAIVLPPVAWKLLPNGWIAKPDKFLGRNWFFPVSHQIFAQKEGKTSRDGVTASR